MKQTAVEWLEDCFNRYGEVLSSDFIKAKEMEKKQQDDFAIEFIKWCENKYVFSTSIIHRPSYEKLLEYYIETFKKK